MRRQPADWGARYVVGATVGRGTIGPAVGARELPRPGSRALCILAVAAIAVLNALDVATTHTLSRLGGTEVNPFANWLLERGLLGDAKAALVVAIAVLVALSQRPQRVLRPLWVVVVVYAAVVLNNMANLHLA